MVLNDPLAAVLSKIENADKIGKKEVVVKFNSTIIKRVLALLKDHKFIGDFEEVATSSHNYLKINLIGNINKVGVIKPRYPVTLDKYESFEKRFLPAKDFGVILVSTPKGLMTHNEAKSNDLGGRLISYCY